MDMIIMVFVCGMCFSQGWKAYNEEKQTKVFCKRNLPLKDVKEYNHFVGKLVIGFSIVATLTFGVMISFSGIMNLICCVLLILEAVAVMKIYAKKEITFIKQN